MFISSKILDSNFSSSRTNQGAVAAEAEIANTRLDMELMSSSPPSTATASERARSTDGAGATLLARAPASLPTVDDSASYIQVVVQKHRRHVEGEDAVEGEQTPTRASMPPHRCGKGQVSGTRVPVTSSPQGNDIHQCKCKADLEKTVNTEWCSRASQDIVITRAKRQDGAEDNVFGITPPPAVPLLLMPPHLPYQYQHARQQYEWDPVAADAGWSRSYIDVATSPFHVSHFKVNKNNLVQGGTSELQQQQDSEKTTSLWKKLSKCSDGKKYWLTPNEAEGPDRVEVYYFERSGGEWLAACSGSRITLTERATRRLSQPLARALQELLAVPQLCVQLPVKLALQVFRCVVVSVREAVVGGLQTVSESALKPTLAALFNTLVHPPLVCAHSMARAVRDTLRPITLLIGDILEPFSRLLAAFRVVDVHLQLPHHLPPACICTLRAGGNR